MAKEFHSHVPESVSKEDSFRYQIEQGTLTNSVYISLSDDDKAVVTKVLKEMHYGFDPIDINTGLESAVFALGKLFFLMFPDPTQYSTEVQAFYPAVKALFDAHDMQPDPNTWYLPYGENVVKNVVSTRQDYFAKSTEIKGS